MELIVVAVFLAFICALVFGVFYVIMKFVADFVWTICGLFTKKK